MKKDIIIMIVKLIYQLTAVCMTFWLFHTLTMATFLHYQITGKDAITIAWTATWFAAILFNAISHK